MESISKTKLTSLPINTANSGWHWHLTQISTGQVFVLEKTL